MIVKFLTKIFGSKNDRELKKMDSVVEKINSLEPALQSLTDDELRSKTSLFKERFKKGESLDEILPEAFAVVREASVRTLEMRHFDAQLLGGIVLHNGAIAEMKTGEGKTLAATLSAYLNAITGKGVHIITVNDYLARRDAEWMGRIYNFLGMSVGAILHGLTDDERKVAYSSDITYGTNNEFGFDYLRDNMKFDAESLAQPMLNYAIVDEVDSILVDEARTPLIISGPAEKSTSLYSMVNGIVPKLKKDVDFTVDEKARSSVLTDEGIANAEKILKVENLYDSRNIELLHHINQAIKAYSLFKRDVDYVVKNGEVIIVDEFTGRLMPGRRYSEGLHQALEAKENVKIENENQTLASITFQNYFRMYNKLSGMTGTADTESVEFKKIYDLDVMVIPTNKKMIRKDFPDVIYKTKKEKFDAAIREMAKLHNLGQPVLVGTVSIDVSEDLSRQLKKKGIKHNVLNAKNHGKEAEIISMAGQKGAVTISTNMAGRGTDIVLGDGVTDLGGLHILGTERHESRRIDNQLRGRAGRQGDPGSSRFYLSLEDDLLRIFGGERISSIMDKLGMEEGESIENRLISKSIENAQSKVEGHNFDMRKHLLEYDDVMNQQRTVIYRQRREALGGNNLKDSIHEMLYDRISENVENTIHGKEDFEQWDIKGLEETVFKQYGFHLDDNRPDEITKDSLIRSIYDPAVAIYNKKEELIGEKDFSGLERFVMLQTVDNLWKDHLLSMDHLKEGIGLRGYAQQDPLIIYKKEGYGMFQNMISRIKEEIVDIMFKIQVAEPEKVPEYNQPKKQNLTFSGSGDEGSTRRPIKRSEEKVGRNMPCPCGSGKKFKKCCGKS